MCANEAIRFKLHERLLALDAANIELMKMVVLSLVGSEHWEEAVAEHRAKIVDLEFALEEQSALRTNVDSGVQAGQNHG